MSLNIKSAEEMRNKIDENISGKVEGFIEELKTKIEDTLNNTYEKNKYVYETSVVVEGSYEVVNKAKKQIESYENELKKLGYKVNVYTKDIKIYKCKMLVFEISW